MKKYVFVIFLLPIALSAQELLVPSLNEDYRDMRAVDPHYHYPMYAPQFSGELVDYCPRDTTMPGYRLRYNAEGYLDSVYMSYILYANFRTFQYDSKKRLISHSQSFGNLVFHRYEYHYDSSGKIVNKRFWTNPDSLGVFTQAEQWNLQVVNDSTHLVSYYKLDTALALFKLSAKRWLYYSGSLLDSSHQYLFMVTDSNQLDSIFYEREYFKQQAIPLGYIESRMTSVHPIAVSNMGYLSLSNNWVDHRFDTLRTDLLLRKQTLTALDTATRELVIEDLEWSKNGDVLSFKHQEPRDYYASFKYRSLGYSYNSKGLQSINVDEFWHQNLYTICSGQIIGELSQDELLNEEVQVYPNPSNGVLKIRSLEGYDLTVYTLSGEKVYSQTNLSAGEYALDLRGQKPGLYLLFLRLENGQLCQEKIGLQ